MFLQCRKLLLALAIVLYPSVWADPCGMVPPIVTGNNTVIQRIGAQKTYVFYRDGIESFVIRPGFSGKVDEFGMLIPFPTPPAIRKIPDAIFSHIAAAIDPPEVVVDLYPDYDESEDDGDPSDSAGGGEKKLAFHEVKVLKQEAVGMYEVAVLAAGSAKALKRWMDDHGFKYPNGMDAACQDYVDLGWCFVAVKTRVAQKRGITAKPGMRNVNPKLPANSTFDGHVQAMGFRFKSKHLVVPMRLSAFNKGELRNIVYILTDKPCNINSIPKKHVMRQLSGEELYSNLTSPLTLRILGGSYQDIPKWRRQSLKQERDPVPHNGLARELFASDLLAADRGRLSHPHEEAEKVLLRIGERLSLRGPQIDKLNMKELEKDRTKIVSLALAKLKGMTITVVDGNFPREVIAKENLTFSHYQMLAKFNSRAYYNARSQTGLRKRARKW